MKRSIQPEGAFGLRKNDICIPQDRLQGVKIGLPQKYFLQQPSGWHGERENSPEFRAMKIARNPGFWRVPG